MTGLFFRARRLTFFLTVLLVTVFAGDAFARGRMYNPELGRFMQRDPRGTIISPFTQLNSVGEPRNLNGFLPREEYNPHLQYKDGMSIYEYVGSQPTYYSDPSGLGRKKQPRKKCDCPNGEEATAVAAVGPSDAWHAGVTLNDEARGKSGDLTRGNGFGGPSTDALRHCYWSCRMAQDIGEKQAEEVGDIHERCKKNNPPLEEQQDLDNNRHGRESARDTPPLRPTGGRRKAEDRNQRDQDNLKTKQDHCMQSCREKWRDGTLSRGNP